MPSNTIRLQINHFFLDPAAMTEAMKMQPTRMWRFGQIRKTSTGAAIDGKARHSFWEYAVPVDSTKGIGEFLDMLESKAAFLSALPSYSGAAEIVVESSDGKKISDALSAADLKRLAALYIEPGVPPAGRLF